MFNRDKVVAGVPGTPGQARDNMKPPLSVVMPTLNSARGLGRAMESLSEGISASLVREVLVSDGGSEDETEDLARALGARFIRGERGRGAQLARGAKEAKGSWLLFLHSDTALEADWATRAKAHMEKPSLAGYFKLRFDSRGLMPRAVAGWANARSAAFGLPYGDQGLLISRGLYDSAGGYPDIPIMEDVVMAQRLKGKLRMIPAVALTSSGKYQKSGWIRNGARNLWLLGRFKFGADPRELARVYRGNDGAS